MPLDVRTGAVFAGFRVESLLGEGAMGKVYLAVEMSSGRRVALKLLAPELARDDRFRRRFLRETELAASLDHPNIVATYASGEEQGTLYLAMAYVDGSDLHELLRGEGALEPERALALLEQVAAALDAAHAAGLVHRDVKPGNVLVAATPDGERAYVCDFGLARHVSSVSSLTSERGFVGTIDYVPPEQIEGGPIDPRADVYSLGCVLFECLAGERPFDRESELSVVFAHLNEPPPRLSDIRPELPQAFDTVFATALAKSPGERYSSCGELAKAARQALGGRVVRRRPGLMKPFVGTAAALLLVAGSAAVAVVTTSGSGHATGARLSLAPGAVNLLAAKSHRLVGKVPYSAGSIAFAGRSAWLLSGEKQQVARVDLRTRKVDRVLDLPWPPGELTTGGGAVWVGEDFGSHVVRIDPRSGKITGRFAVDEGGISGAAYGAGSLWLARGSEVLRVDPSDGRVLRRIAAPAQRMVYSDGALWTATPDDGRLAKIDPAEDRVVAHQKLHPWLSDLAVGGGSVWASIIPDGAVFRLSEDDLGVQGSSGAGSDPEQLSFGGGRLWIANTAAKAVSSLDEVSGKRVQLESTAQPKTTVYHKGLIWTVAAATPKPLPPISGQVLRVSTPTDTAVDPDPMGGKGSVAQFIVRNLRQPAPLPRRFRGRGRPTAARDRRGDAGCFERRPHLHVPHPPGLPLLSALERAGHGRDVPAHTRTFAVSEEPVLGGAISRA